MQTPVSRFIIAYFDSAWLTVEYPTMHSFLEYTFGGIHHWEVYYIHAVMHLTLYDDSLLYNDWLLYEILRENILRCEVSCDYFYIVNYAPFGMNRRSILKRIFMEWKKDYCFFWRSGVYSIPSFYDKKTCIRISPDIISADPDLKYLIKKGFLKKVILLPNTYIINSV